MRVRLRVSVEPSHPHARPHRVGVCVEEAVGGDDDAQRGERERDRVAALEHVERVLQCARRVLAAAAIVLEHPLLFGLGLGLGFGLGVAAIELKHPLLLRLGLGLGFEFWFGLGLGLG